MNKQKKIFNQFSKGFISSSDISSLKAPSDSFSDALNFDINKPFYALSRSKGYKTGDTFPNYSGIPIALRKWSVDIPSSKDIQTLVMRSNNLLLFSEDFEINSVWTLTAGGATLTANSQISIQGIRKADRLTNVSNATSISYLLTGLDSTKPYTFSIYAKSPDAIQIQLTIDGTSYTESMDAGWNRFSVTKSSLSSSSITISISFPDAGTTDTVDIWGAQVEQSSTATTYGYTTFYAKPYYIWMNPYYIDGTWYDAWIELNEMRAGKVTAYTSSTITIANMDGSNDYYNNWQIAKTTSSASGGYVLDYASGVFTVPDNTSEVTTGDYVVVSRYANTIEGDLINASYVDESKIGFVEANGVQIINFGYNAGSYVVYYKKQTVFSSVISVDRFFFSAENKNYAYNIYNDGLDISCSNTAGGSLTGGTYSWWIVAIIDGQRYAWKRGSLSASLNDKLVFTFSVKDYLFVDHRLRYAELYVAPVDVSDENYAILQTTIDITDTGGLTWSYDGTFDYYYNSATEIASVNTDNNSLVQNIQRGFDAKLPHYYDYRVYIRSRMFIAGVNSSVNPTTGYPRDRDSDIVRFSSIANLVKEINVFPFDYSAGYGEVIVETGTSDNIKGLAVTPSNDLLVFKGRSTFLYEVASQSSQLGKKLIQAYSGIGCINWRGIQYSSDYGVFWFDANGIYNYTGSIGAPIDLSFGKIKNYWRSLKDSAGAHFAERSNCFAHFNRALNEYWIFIQTSEANGDYRDYKVLRYSVEYKNWNILQFDKVPIFTSEEIISGELILIFDGYNYPYNYGYDDSQLPASTLTSHLVDIDDDQNYKRIVETFCEYSSGSDIVVTVLIGDETSARSGNTHTYSSSFKNKSRPTKIGSIGRKFKMSIAQSSANALSDINSVGINYVPQDRKFGL